MNRHRTGGDVSADVGMLTDDECPSGLDGAFDVTIDQQLVTSRHIAFDKYPARQDGAGSSHWRGGYRSIRGSGWRVGRCRGWGRCHWIRFSIGLKHLHGLGWVCFQPLYAKTTAWLRQTGFLPLCAIALTCHSSRVTLFKYFSFLAEPFRLPCRSLTKAGHVVASCRAVI
jgi:hypothetical protein